VSEYEPEVVGQVAELARIVKRGQPLGDVALIMFARGHWVREDTLRAGYRRILCWLDSLVAGCGHRDSPFDISEVIAGEMLTSRTGAVAALRRRLQATHKIAVRDRATALARVRAEQHLRERILIRGGGRPDITRAKAETATPAPTPEEIATAKAQFDSVEETLRTVLQNIVHPLLAGEATSEDALSELLTAFRLQPPGVDMQIFAGPLSAITLPVLKRQAEVVPLAELELARDQVKGLVVEPGWPVPGGPSDLLVALGALAITAIAPHI
jgi:hypothetical protein